MPQTQAPTTESRKPAAGEIGYREFAVDTRTIDEEARTVELAFSSEEPVARWYGEEVLDHASGAVRLERMNNGAALLLQHDSDRQLGVVESARIDRDRRGRAVVRFGRGQLAEEIFRDVQDGIRRHVSVGYRIHEMKLDRSDAEGDTYRITDWEPLEVSIVSVPADATVGVGRAHPPTLQPEDATMPKQAITETADEGREDPTVTPAEVAGESTEERTEQSREAVDAEIRALAGKHKAVPRAREIAEQLIAVGGTVDDMQRALRNAIVNAPAPQPVPAVRDVRVEGARPRYKTMRAFSDEEVAYQAGMWARATLLGDDKAMRWCNDHGVRVMTGAALSKGGAVVPEQMSQAIIDLRERYGVARQLLRIVPMASDTLMVPRRTGGVTAYFVGEEDAITASDKSWDQVQLTARKLGALTRFSTDYAEDAVIDVAEDLANEMAYAFAEKEDDCCFNGDGTSTYGGIVGFRTKIIDGNHSAGAIDAASNHDTFAELDADDINSLMAALPEYAADMATFVCSRPANTLVFDALKQAAGGNTIQTLAGRPQLNYLGYPIRISQKMPTSIGDLSNVAMLLFGDFSKAATMGDRRGFTIRVLNERYAEYDQIGIVATERFDIVVHDLGDTSVAGPVVALIGE